MPLVVGNITTVGAFLALVPLKSVALRDLGLFSSLLLIGTILFVLIYLPHLIASGTTQKTHNIFSRISDFSLENKRWIVNTTILLTIVFGYFSFQTDFDANISHINYMTDAQKADMAYFSSYMTDAQKADMAYFSSSSNANQVYVVSSDTLMDGALDKSLQLQPFLSDLQQQGCSSVPRQSRHSVLPFGIRSLRDMVACSSLLSKMQPVAKDSPKEPSTISSVCSIPLMSNKQPTILPH